MADKNTNIKLSSQEADSWRDLAATCGIFIPRGIGSGDTGNAAEAIRRVGRAYQRAPQHVVALLRPLLLESGEALPQMSNGDQLGIGLEPVEALEAREAEPPVLQLPGARTPGGEARLVLLEFEVFRAEQGLQARPLSFIVHFPHGSEGMTKSGQQYLLRYDLAGKAILRDWGFSPLGHIDIIGPGARGVSPVYQDLYHAPGEWGYYWAALGELFSIGTAGKTIRYPHLPRQMLPYLQSLLQPATIRSMDIFCAKCHGWQSYSEELSPYWCEHIWWCKKCQRVSSPEVRARRLFGTHRCSHHSPEMKG